jgi:hypothetical protein
VASASVSAPGGVAVSAASLGFSGRTLEHTPR